MRAACMIAREPHRLHHRLGARHMERHLVQPGDLLDAFDVVGNDRVVGAEYRPEVTHTLSATRDAVLVEVVAKQIDAVGIGNVIQDIPVNIADGHAGGGFKNGTGGQVFADMAAKLERDPVGRGELKIGGSALHLGGQSAGPRESIPINRGEPQKPILSSARDALGWIVRAEEPVFIVLVERHHRCNPSRQPRMSRKRPVLRHRQFDPSFGLDEWNTQRRGTRERGCENRQFHGGCMTPSGTKSLS